MKLLYIGNIGDKVGNFSESAMLAAQEYGWEFQIAANWTGYNDYCLREEDEEKYGIKIHQVDFIRKPYDVRNLEAYHQICQIIKDEKIDIIHCNTPIGGVIGRLAGEKCGVKHIIYQAHGFHFYSGAPLINWLLYYPIERFLAHYTDALATINQEDYLRAQKMRLRKNGRVYYVPSVGINYNRFASTCIDKNKKRTEIGVPENAFLIISVGELNENKNQSVIIKAIAALKDTDIHYVIVGKGSSMGLLKEIAKTLGVDKQVHFLGFREDVNELYACADVCAFPSRREGLGMAAIEGMASGLPLICSDNAGTRDYASDGENAIVCKYNDVDSFAKGIVSLKVNPINREKMGLLNKKIAQKYDTSNSILSIKKIYEEVVGR